VRRGLLLTRPSPHRQLLHRRRHLLQRRQPYLRRCLQLRPRWTPRWTRPRPRWTPRWTRPLARRWLLQLLHKQRLRPKAGVRTARSLSPSRRGSLRARCVDALRLAPATYYYSRTRGRGHERREHDPAQEACARARRYAGPACSGHSENGPSYLDTVAGPLAEGRSRHVCMYSPLHRAPLVG
jgi:hypothetical protein